VGVQIPPSAFGNDIRNGLAGIYGDYRGELRQIIFFLYLAGEIFSESILGGVRVAGGAGRPKAG
jgi:hypothetical protein